MELNKIHQGDALKVLKTLSDKSVHCVITSPPYYGLRDYGTAIWIGGDKLCNHRRDTKNVNPDYKIQSRGKTDNGVADEIFKHECAKCGAKRIDLQVGLEKTPEAYVRKLVLIFREVRRVLRNDGTLWLNIGDSYYGSWGNTSKTKDNNGFHSALTENKAVPAVSINTGKRKGLKAKDLIGIPWMLAIALRKDGWYLRQDIIWNKPNPMPESVTDRCTKSHEYIFLLSKSAKYYFDQAAIRRPLADSTIIRALQAIENQKGSDRLPGKSNGPMKVVIKRTVRKGIDTHGGQGRGEISMAINGTGSKNHSGYHNANGQLIGDGTANKKSVWTVATMPFKEAHFATFPQQLITDCIKAGCPGGGVILDPFMGAGTTALVARKLHRNFIGIELNPAYIKLAEKRLKKELGLFI